MTTGLKHTPAPWLVEDADGYITGHVTAKAHNYCGHNGIGARRDSVTHPDSMIMADAHLIAAAPDLLEALKLTKKLFAQDGLESPDAEFLDEESVKGIVEAAIAKAEGDTQ